VNGFKENFVTSWKNWLKDNTSAKSVEKETPKKAIVE
jgi:hypothetical protein